MSIISLRSVKVTFVERDGEEITVDAKIGDTLLEVAKEYDVDLEGKEYIESNPARLAYKREAMQHCRQTQNHILPF